MNSLTFSIFILVAIFINTIVGNATGAIQLIQALPNWSRLAFYATNILYGASCYLAFFCRVGWWRWVVLVAMAIVEVAIRNATGATLALNMLPQWQGWLFINSIFLIGIFGGIWVRKLHEERRFRGRPRKQN
jgi:hypothetical protein